MHTLSVAATPMAWLHKKKICFVDRIVTSVTRDTAISAIGHHDRRGAAIYTPEMTDLINAKDGACYLDMTPRVCVRGEERVGQRDDLGYRWSAAEEIFPFLELRCAALDLRQPANRCTQAEFDRDCRRRIRAQLHTLAAHGVRHVSAVPRPLHHVTSDSLFSTTSTYLTL